MTKSISLAVVAFGAATAVMAQNVVDAVRYGTTEISGTARYRSMAGAFGALGGDPSVLNDNPAGMAVYRSTSVVSLTPHLAFTGTTSAGTETDKCSSSNFSLSDASIILSHRTMESDNIVNVNFGFSISRQMGNYSKYNNILDDVSSNATFGQYLKNQANNYLNGVYPAASYLSWNNIVTRAPFLSMMAYECNAIADDVSDKHRVIDPLEGNPSYQRLFVNEKTRNDHYNIAASININDMLYVGATVRITDFNSIIKTEFDEDYSYDYSGSFTAYDNDFETKGSGIGINAGIIWTPVDQLRIGAAVHTPDWITVTELYDGYMWIDTEAYSEYYDSWKYDFSTPWEYQLSAAYIFGTRGLLSVEYDLRDFSTMSYSANKEYGLQDKYFTDANDAISRYLTQQHTFKVGAEVRATQHLSVRAGYAFSTSPYTDEALYGQIPTADINQVYYSSTKPNFQTLGNQYYLTCGIGWRGKQWYADASLMYHHTKYHTAAYPGDFCNSSIVDVSCGQKNIDVTIGYRF